MASGMQAKKAHQSPAPTSLTRLLVEFISFVDDFRLVYLFFWGSSRILRSCVPFAGYPVHVGSFTRKRKRSFAPTPDLGGDKDHLPDRIAIFVRRHSLLLSVHCTVIPPSTVNAWPTT
jgi:hypothetical protein